MSSACRSPPPPPPSRSSPPNGSPSPRCFSNNAVGRQPISKDAPPLDLASLIDSLPDALLVTEADGKLLLWSAAAERLFGWARTEALGKNVDELLAPNGREAAAAAVLRRRALQSGRWEGDLRHKAKDGRELVAAHRWLVWPGPAGPGLLRLCCDATEKKKRETLQTRLQRMENVAAMVDGIAHDFTNVLAPALMSISIFRRKFPDPETQSLIDSLEESLRHGADVVRQVKTFSKTALGERVSVPLGSLLREIIHGLEAEFPKNVRLQTVLPDGLWPVRGDEAQLCRAFHNLCANAKDAMPDGGVLTLSAGNEELDEGAAKSVGASSSGRYVVVSVKDTGPGVPADIRERVFDPFFTTKEASRATGVGLSIARGIVQGHDGAILLASPPGQGAEFKVYLPCVSPTASAQAAPAAGPAKTPPLGGGALILVVDDEPAHLAVTRAALEAHGYRVETASDGPRAVALYAQHKDDVRAVLMDMKMPGMDGRHTIRALRQIKTGVPVLASTGFRPQETAASVIEDGVAAFLQKPYATDDLLRALARVLDIKS